ncbi:MAG: 5-formyltetrahydrofolate cyclo-ligase, partial [Aestuariivirga sp.]
MSIAEIKKSARGAAAKRRAEAHAALKDEAGLALAARGLPDGLADRRGIVSGFIPYKSEITTLPLMAALLRLGWRTALPVVIAPDTPLVFRAWSPGDRLEPGVWDIPVPLAAAPEVLPDLLLVPGLSFDRKGFRLGYGGGFYDRTLAKLRAVKPVTAIGVAYHAQIVDEVVRDAFDAPLDYLMTER